MSSSRELSCIGRGPTPVASAMMFSWVIGDARAPPTSPAIWPSRMTSTRSQMPMISGSSLEMTMMPMPLVRKLVDDPVDFGLGADVDAARRLVEDQDLRADLEPARQQHLLLVAAGEAADRDDGARRADAERLETPCWRGSARPCRRLSTPPSAGVAAEARRC